MSELSVRVVTLMPPELVKEIDEFMWGRRLSSRGHAIRDLVEAGLKCAGKNEPPTNVTPLRNDKGGLG